MCVRRDMNPGHLTLVFGDKRSGVPHITARERRGIERKESMKDTWEWVRTESKKDTWEWERKESIKTLESEWEEESLAVLMLGSSIVLTLRESMRLFQSREDGTCRWLPFTEHGDRRHKKLLKIPAHARVRTHLLRGNDVINTLSWRAARLPHKGELMELVFLRIWQVLL